MTNQIDIDALEKLAREAKGYLSLSVFQATLRPDTVLALIERVRAAESYAESLNQLLEARDAQLSRAEERASVAEEVSGRYLHDAKRHQRAQLAAEAELARLREQEPIYQMRLLDGTELQNEWIEVTAVEYAAPTKSYEWERRKLYAEPRPAVLPPEMVAEPEKYDVIDHGFIAGYNQAIADARALGCQPQRFEAPDYFAGLVSSAVEAAQKAMVKFPQPNYVLLKVAEEAGEVVQAGVHYAEGRETWKALEGEVVQTIAMLYRLVTEGDHVNGVIPPKAAGGEVEE